MPDNKHHDPLEQIISILDEGQRLAFVKMHEALAGFLDTPIAAAVAKPSAAPVH